MAYRPRAIAALIIAGVSLAGCAAPPPRLYETPSGRPEATFDGTTPTQVLGKLAGLCMDRRGIVIAQDANQVLCQKELPPGDAILAQLLIGNQYSTTPVLKVRFSAAQIGSQTRVQVYSWIETQMAFGQVQTSEVTSNQNFNNIEETLIQLGGHVERAPPAVP